MSDNRKYYYLKLKENYFDDDSIVLLESMQDGVLYSNILLKLYLKSLKHGGRLQLDENIPYTAQMIATITRQQIGTVERALQIFLKLGLVEVLDSGTFYMSNIELLIGQSSTEAERKRAARLQNKALSAPPNGKTSVSGAMPTKPSHAPPSTDTPGNTHSPPTTIRTRFPPCKPMGVGRKGSLLRTLLPAMPGQRQTEGTGTDRKKRRTRPKTAVHRTARTPSACARHNRFRPPPATPSGARELPMPSPPEDIH